MSDLQELFDSLAQPAAGAGSTRFAVVPIADDLRHLVGKDQAGFPAVLIDASNNHGTQLLRVELQHLTVHPDLHCEVVFPDGHNRSGNYTLIRCSGDEELQHLFLRLLGGLLAEMRPTAERAELAQIVVRLVDLFRALAAPPRKSIQGLWAELFLIAQSRNPIALLEAWHADPRELCDFNHGRQRIEVKSASHRVRVHTTTLDQLYPPAGTVGVIVSVVTERTGGGTTVDELVERISDACVSRPELQLKVRSLVSETLGMDWRLGARTRFDWNEAVATCAMYLCEDVPRIPLANVPAGITHIRFDMSLDDVLPQDRAAMSALGGLIEAALPRSGVTN